MKKNIFALTLLLLIGCLGAQAQNSRKYIKQQIEKWGECRNVALTLYGGDVALYGKNGYASDGIPRDMLKALRELHDEGSYIDDVQLTENGSWLILYGNNGFRWDGISSSLESTLRRYNADKEVVTSVTFNDNGDWLVISTEHWSASDERYNAFIREGMNKYGNLWAAHFTNDALVLCYERGYKYLGNVPQNLKNKLSETSLNVYRIKFLSDGTYFIADKNERYSYYM